MTTEIKVNKPQLEAGWLALLQKEFEADYFKKLKAFLVEERSKHDVYPAGADMFNAFNFTPLDKVKVVILGQDPYHGAGQAHGLCFSVPVGIKPPPSLVNIFKELKSDIGNEIPTSGNLEKWAHQGILLLNATLTVRANTAGSHQHQGWETFTDSVIKAVSDTKEHVVFILWGKYAQAKDVLIDSSKHLILKAAHPSPFSAHTGFLGCKHFSKTNDYLSQHNISAIDWKLS